MEDSDPKQTTDEKKVYLVVDVNASGTKIVGNHRGGYDYHFLASLSDGSDLVCKICCLPSRNPHLSSCCGHTFCKFCINNLKETTTLSNGCPVCRDSQFPVVQNKQIDRAVRSLHVYCINEKEGCKWQGEINDIATHHLNHCEYARVMCENNGCKSIVQRQLLENHMQEDCPYRDANCQHCHLKGSHCFIVDKHQDECPKFPLPCPNGCEVGTITREDLDKHREICPLEMITCEYHDMGCEVKISRKDVQDHNRENVEEHLCMVKCELASTKKELMQAHKDAKATDKKLDDLQKKFQEQIDNMETQRQENIKRFEMQLYNSLYQLQKNCNPWTLKLDTLAAMTASGDQVVPVVLKMMNFSKVKREKEWWSSDHFYSLNKECKMCLLVCLDGNTDRKGGYVSVQLSLLYDESEFPLKGMIKLLNQIDDQEHHCVTVDCCNTTNNTVTKNDWVIFSEWKNHSFISHNDLNAVSDTCNFLKNDCLFFEVYMRMYATEKSQKSHPLFSDNGYNSATDLNDSLSSPSATKVRRVAFLHVYI